MKVDELQVFSDSHYYQDTKNEKITDKILKERVDKNHKYLFLGGDIIDSTGKGNDGLAEKLQQIINTLSKEYDKIITVLGNHEFRAPSLQTKKGYNEFKRGLNKNIIFPKGITKPTIEQIEKTKILVGNLFYDMDFLDPSLFGFTKEEILKFYRGGNFTDGLYLFNGEVEIFSKMREELERYLNSEIDMLFTHSLPHPSLVQFLTLGDILELQEKLGKYIKVKNPGERHYKEAEKLGISIQEYMNGYNAKSYFMGSNVLKNPEKIKNGLICFFGHSHRDLDYEERNILGEKVIFKSKQYINN